VQVACNALESIHEVVSCLAICVRTLASVWCIIARRALVSGAREALAWLVCAVWIMVARWPAQHTPATYVVDECLARSEAS
jgi:hypothetical protein